MEGRQVNRQDATEQKGIARSDRQADTRTRAVWHQSACCAMVIGMMTVLMACGTDRNGTEMSPAARFEHVEKALLGAEGVSVQTRIESRGAFPASLSGQLAVASGNRASIQVNGVFGPQHVDLYLKSDGGRLQGGSEGGRFDVATPAGLNESLVIGCTRMGFLHNLARLTAGMPPDRQEGGVQDWVEVTDFVRAADKEIYDVVAPGIRFAIIVEGKPAGEATLWVHPDLHLPLHREQIVRFADGEMRVVEQYVWSDDASAGGEDPFTF